MSQTQRHPFVSVFIDGYFFTPFIFFIKEKVNYSSSVDLMIGIFFVAVFIFYYGYYYKKTNLRTIGEHMTGTVIDKVGSKYYYNPFKYNRFVLWLVMLIYFVGLKNFKTLLSNNLSSNLVIVNYFIIIIVSYTAYLLINKGKRIGFVIIILLYSIKLFLIIFKSYKTILFNTSYQNLESLFLIVSILVLIFYWYNLNGVGGKLKSIEN